MADTTMIRVPVELRNRAKAAAALDGVTMEQWIATAILAQLAVSEQRSRKISTPIVDRVANRMRAGSVQQSNRLTGKPE